jgi:hypothetical protein
MPLSRDEQMASVVLFGEAALSLGRPVQNDKNGYGKELKKLSSHAILLIYPRPRKCPDEKNSCRPADRDSAVEAAAGGYNGRSEWGMSLLEIRSLL